MNFMKNRMIHGESSVWSTVQRSKKIYRFDLGTIDLSAVAVFICLAIR